MAKAIDKQITSIATAWEGYAGSRVEEFIKAQLSAKHGAFDVATGNGTVTIRAFSDADTLKQWRSNPDANASLVLSAASFSISADLSNVIVDFSDESTADEYVFQGVNASGEAVGEPLRFTAGGGGGSTEGTKLNIYPETQGVWGAYGSRITLNVAIKSVSYDGAEEILGTIKTVGIIDASTKQSLYSATVNAASSTSAKDYSFTFDFTDYITAAGTKDFIITATDADGNSKNRTVSVTAVDVTVTSTQTLPYSEATSLAVGSTKDKTIAMYQFASNVSAKQGVLVTTEMYYNGAWRALGTATVTDSYGHNITINPSNVFGGGEKLTHGAYLVRVHGVDVASGVKGNTLYTTVMAVESGNKTPIVAIRWYDNNDGDIKLYETLTFDVAAYTLNEVSTPVDAVIDGTAVASVNIPLASVYTVSKQIQGYVADGSKTIPFYAHSGGSASGTLSVRVYGSVIDATLKDGADFAYDFSMRSNSESDHTISDNGITMTVKGANYNSNGFCQVLGEQVLRIAENVTAEIPYQPFTSSAIETVGCALQMAFSTKSIKDKTAMLCRCYDESAGVGFYIRGNDITLTVLNGTPKQQRVTFKNGEKVTVAVVVEPSSKYVTYKASDSASGQNYAHVKLYVNGEECAAIGYKPSSSALRQSKPITFDSASGDFNLNYIMAYGSYMGWLQAFNNYLCKISDVSTMISEYDANQVLDSLGKPSLALMEAKGIPYYVIVADQATFNNFDYALNGGTNTSDQFACTLYYYHPERPETNFKATNVLWRRQGTTSAQRPIKNDRFNFNKKNKTTGLKATVTLLNPDDSTELGRKAIMAAKYNKVLVDPDGHAVDIITVKVDYSDSSNANDCGVCNMMNATFRALGGQYLTPAQRAFDGTQTLGEGDVLSGVHLDHSTKNHPIAVFRATQDNLTDAWFHAKGNWKEDKGEQTALGFQGTPGYNKGCLNYGDFTEFFGEKDETLAQTEARFKTTEGLNTSAVYLISQYCGRDYAIYRYKSGEWTRSTGSMKQVNGKWVVTGDVLNPVSGYELLQYAGMDWWQGVSSVDDMMAMSSQQSSWVGKLGLSATQYPAWTYYFECMIDNDQLQADLALGKKVPYDLFNVLRFLNSCDYSKVEGWKTIWQQNAYRYMSLESAMAYTGFTDYLAAVDQRAKNMQPMFFLEDGCSVVDGTYISAGGYEPTRMYLNKVYDCDTCNGADNDGGRDIDPEVDPNKPTDEATGYQNPYMGRGSVLFNNIDGQQECWNANDSGKTTISLKKVIEKMRTTTAQVDGKTMAPFSPDGAQHYFVESILKFWPKVISSYDGERKYIDNTNIANMLYFYALHGLGLTQLPRFIEQRWAIRDGYYQTGDFFTNPLSGRVSALSADSKIYITAAATGYFGIGNDASGQLSETVYLEAGQSHAFTNFAHDAGALLYIYQPSRMKSIDLSEMSLAYHFNDLSKLTLCEEIILGGSKHTSNASINGYAGLSNIDTGDMPFLRKIDVSGTTATGLDLSGCPRIESVDASNTSLTTVNIAQTSPVTSLKLPDTITSLVLVNLPNLTYPGGLTIAGVNKISKIWLEGCAHVDTETLLLAVAQTGAVKQARVTGVNITAKSSILSAFKSSGVIGLDDSGNPYEESGRCSGVLGRWILADLVEDSVLSALQEYFPHLAIKNAQYSALVMDDTVSDPRNLTNLENGTVAANFTASGHVLKLRERMMPVRGKLDTDTGKWTGKRVSNSHYWYYNDGTLFDYKDTLGEGLDVMMLMPKHWYKGVNDYKNQKKYIFWSSQESTPDSTAEKTVRYPTLSKLLYKSGKAIFVDNVTVGTTSIASAMGDAGTYNVYAVDVEGMKQVRFPGVNSAAIGVCFCDAKGVVVKKWNMAISHTYFDFREGCYVFVDVPNTAKTFYFSSKADVLEPEVIVTDSSQPEAIEPDWVFANQSLLGIYPSYVDEYMRLRSISVNTITCSKGNGCSTDWTYDDDGNPTNTPSTASTYYGWLDFHNLAARRGKGYQLEDYEQHKFLALLWWCLYGNRNIAAVNKYNFNYNTQKSDPLGNVNILTTDTMDQSKVLGIASYFSRYSFLDNVVRSTSTWREFILAHGIAAVSRADPWNIYDPHTKTQRKLSFPTSGWRCAVRMLHGRYCDILASAQFNDSGGGEQYYGDWAQMDGGGNSVMCVGGQGHSSQGIFWYECSDQMGYNKQSQNPGTRLAFRGDIEITD